MDNVPGMRGALNMRRIKERRTTMQCSHAIYAARTYSLARTGCVSSEIDHRLDSARAVNVFV